ncbi:hypothetical protein [Methanoculleus sp.]|jgi:hypothetical protein|uniref:hypothetical protein n=1 Tax=Methanoculleus sp. TaxID=90427 RepID=UPI0025CE8E30|nr:hypothetical protein [Methanoculleus sp.]MCK9319766.1 hypothetical protein [Methanoculleus sp.]
MKVRLQELLLFITTFLLVAVIIIGSILLFKEPKKYNKDYKDKYIAVETLNLSNHKEYTVFFDARYVDLYSIETLKDKPQEVLGECEVYVMLQSYYYSAEIYEKVTTTKVKVYKIEGSFYVKATDIEYDLNRLEKIKIRSSLKWQSTY